ncbi:MAG: NAD(P)H-dependent glycerol-3-phosphate dehydrogenase [Blastocatellia bacterium]
MGNEARTIRNISVIGAGSWGTALAVVAARAGNSVRLWAHDPGLAAQLCRTKENTVYLPDVKLPDQIRPVSDPAEAVQDAGIVLMVVPSHVFREVFSRVAPFLKPGMILVSATKGIEIDSGMRIEQVAQDVIRSRFALQYATLSGPSFAQEVGKGDPCAVVVAARSEEWAIATQAALSAPGFRIYTNTDVTGVEIGGAIKNVMAIATGAVNGLGLGYNSAAAIVTRGLAEMTRLAVRLGGKIETMAGLAGVGDLMLTCFGALSRNRHVGYELGRGRALQEITREMREIAEGVKTARAAHELALRLGIEMPITTGVYQMLYEGKSPRDLARELMERPLREEWQTK